MPVAVTWDAAFTACSARAFADRLAGGGPYADMQACLAAARHIWWQEVGVEGWLEAFSAHPEIGDAGACVCAVRGTGGGVSRVSCLGQSPRNRQ
jgi:hypothetical protein